MPILLLILLGYLARRSGMLSDTAVAQINRFNFRFGYFALLFINVYGVDLTEKLPLMLVALVMGSLALLALIGWVVSAALTKERKRRGVLIQTAFRSNYAIIGMMLAQALAGEQGTLLVAIVQLPAVLFFNITSVLAMSIYSDSEEKPSALDVLKSVIENPLIQGILTAIVILVIRCFIPLGDDGLPVFTLQKSVAWLYSAMLHLSRMAPPLSLIVLGASLRITQARDFLPELIGGVLMRLVMGPVVGFAVMVAADRAGLITLGPAETSMLVSVFGSPLATASAIMAREMGADDALAGQLVVWTSVFSMPSLFILVAVLRGMGLL